MKHLPSDLGLVPSYLSAFDEVIGQLNMCVGPGLHSKATAPEQMDFVCKMKMLLILGEQGGRLENKHNLQLKSQRLPKQIITKIGDYKFCFFYNFSNRVEILVLITHCSSSWNTEDLPQKRVILSHEFHVSFTLLGWIAKF